MDHSESNIMSMYYQKNFESLANTYLGIPINDEGDTIVHIISQNLDKNAFQEILKHNNMAITYSIINMPNRKSRYPLHAALDSILKDSNPNYEFIDYMINVLGANPKNPDNNDRIIVIDDNNDNNDNESETHPKSLTNEKINKLNKTVINNIKKLTMLLDKKNNSNYKNTHSDMSMNTNVEFIKDIVDHYNKQNILNGSDVSKESNKKVEVNSQDLTGGYTGQRRIKKYTLADEHDMPSRKTIPKYAKQNNDTFALPHDVKEKIREKMDGGNTNQIRMMDSNLKNQQKEMKTNKNEYKLMEEKLMNQRLFGGDNTELRKKQHSIGQKIKELNEKNKKMYGGAKKQTKTKRTKKRSHRHEDSDSETVFGGNDTSDFNNIDLDDHDDGDSIAPINDKFKEQNETLNFNDSDDDNHDDHHINRNINDIYKNNDSEDVDVDDVDDVNDVDIEDRYQSNEDSNDYDTDDDTHDDNYKMNRPEHKRRHKREKTEEQKKIDEIYRSFIKTIMDNMGIDEEKAKLYRSALKITLEEAHPELKGKINDGLKIKEMENIISNKEKLKSALKKIDFNKIKDTMEERKNLAEKRREEFKKMREDNMKNRKTEKPIKSTKSIEPNNSSNSSESPKSSESSEPPKKPKKRTKKSKVPESGYLESEDIIISSEDN